MCYEAIDDSLAVLKPPSDCYVTRKMIRNVFNSLYAGENIL